MHPMPIEGATRTIGESQGYIGLPLRDIVIDSTVDGPNTPAMQSAWALDRAERDAIARGAPIILTVFGTRHPPVVIQTGALLADTPTDRHNQIVATLIGLLVGDGTDRPGTLVLTESVLVGVALATIRLGGDEVVLDTMFAAAKARLAEIRLGDVKAAGEA